MAVLQKSKITLVSILIKTCREEMDMQFNLKKSRQDEGLERRSPILPLMLWKNDMAYILYTFLFFVFLETDLFWQIWIETQQLVHTNLFQKLISLLDN